MTFPALGARVADVRARIKLAAERGGHGQAVTIVAVTKTHGADAVRAAWEAGIHDVGENRVQEALGKMPEVSEPVRWHLIGHLQRNKVKALDRFAMFHALDSPRLADSVDAFGRDRGRAVQCLVQVNAAREGTKGGFYFEELAAASRRLTSMNGVRVEGVMTLGRLDADETELRRTFGIARDARQLLSGDGHPASELSMGMSGDYEIAVEEGATIVRLGTTLFGVRA
jgi:pyridoxal phosphate enzyme (YggS family)